MFLFPSLKSLSGKLPVKAKWRAAADEVLRRESEFQSFGDQRLHKESLALRYEVLSGQSLESVLVRAFALVREAASRHLKMRHYPVQLIGGAAMTEGAIAVMQTGEGKTLTATLPLYLAALAGKGAHLATANDYLAVRDADTMRPLFAALGMTVGVIEQKTERQERQAAYASDITYSTAREIGFDFLRDRLLKRENEEAAFVNPLTRTGEQPDLHRPVQRPQHFMLVDEADSILVDEARTPLVISSLPDDLEERRVLYEWASGVTGQLSEGKDYELDEETGGVTLMQPGRSATRKFRKPTGLSQTPMIDIYDQVELALFVEEKFVCDRHYVVRDGEVVIVDEFTGRMAEGRKWRAGLHQAIEARERLEVTAETAEAARITVQDLFLKYDHLCGMTGTVANSARELHSIYSTPVVHIPTNKPPQRVQLPDLVFGDHSTKWNAIVDEVVKMNSQSRPVLVGTRSIDKSETLSKLLTDAGIDHRVLNARQLASEAEIVSEAGRAGQVTVATNMAGRGTDIRLSKEALDAGGLHVIISELHESERIDRQLVGRCGRQGDPGSYRVFLSMEDDILKTGLGPRFAARMKVAGEKNGNQPAELARIFRRAQSRVESRHFKGRKMLLNFERNRQTAQRELGQDPYVDTIS